MSQPGQDLLMGNAPSVQLERINDRFDGRVVRVNDPYQSRKMDNSNELAWWDPPNNTQPKMVIPITVINDLDGKEYTLHVGQSSDLQKKISEAVRSTGAQGLEENGHLSIAYIASEPSTMKGARDKKIHAVAYSRPPSGGNVALMNGQQAQAQANPQATQQAAAAALAAAQQAAQANPAPVVPPAPPVQQPAAQSAAAGGLDLSNLSPEVQEAIRQLQQQAAAKQADQPPF